MALVVEFTKYVLIVVVGLLPIMNPLTTIPIFMSLTGGMSETNRRLQAKKACLFAFCILSSFLLLGSGIITLFGISMPGIRIAGGIIIMILALRMIFSGDDVAASVDAEPAQIKKADLDYSFSPLAMPSLSGPGSIAVVMGFGSRVPDEHRLVGYAIVLIGIAITVAIAYLALSSSRMLARLLGDHGVQAVTKIMGFLLTCIAVEFLASGIREFYVDFVQERIVA